MYYFTIEQYYRLFTYQALPPCAGNSTAEDLLVCAQWLPALLALLCVALSVPRGATNYSSPLGASCNNMGIAKLPLHNCVHTLESCC